MYLLRDIIHFTSFGFCLCLHYITELTACQEEI
nr:MAG TPA: hypothetical protein [Caudoviricetes sp.]